jgi:hypothetical protein
VTPRKRKEYIVVLVSPVMAVLAWSVAGTLVQVFWSVEYCHSYEARCATAFARSLTEPGRVPASTLIALLG